MPEPPPWIQVGRSALVCDAGADIPRTASLFEHHRVVLLRRFVDVDLLTSVRHLIGHAAFAEYSHGRFGREVCLPDEAAASALMHLVLNDPRLFRFVEGVTGCRSIGCLTGRIYRMVPDAGHFDDWHTDALDSRLVGLSVNLSEGAFEGGVFQLRDRGSDRLRFEVANTGFGDAILFGIDPRFEHHVSPVRGSIAKTAFAGWFNGQPSFLSLLRSRRAQSEQRIDVGRTK